MSPTAPKPKRTFEVTSPRKPPTVEEVLAEHDRLAEAETAKNKAALPPKPAATPAAAPQTLPAVVAKPQLPATMPVDGRTPAERYVADNTANFMPGPLVTFNGKVGVFAISSSKEEISPQRKFKALLHGTWAGHIMFPEDGGPPERWGGLMYEPGFVFPDRQDLGHHDESLWPEGFDGEPLDPLQHQILFPIVDVETQEIFCFGTTSKTGRGAAYRLLDAYNRKLRAGSDEVPIIQLVPSSYTSKRGPQPIPSFPVCGWAKPDAAPATLAEDLSDSLPF